MTNSIFFNDYLNRNHASLAQMVNELFDHVSSRLLVIRIDFIYRSEFKDQITLDLVQEHRSRLLDNRRRNKKLFADLLGYAWSLEHGSYDPKTNIAGTGFHHHFLFLFNGHIRNLDINIGLAIANYFDTVITHGMSHSYVSNFDKAKFEKNGTLGIGSIAHNDIEERNNLLSHVAGYLAKGTLSKDGSEQDVLFGKYRRFGRSQLDPIPVGTIKRGRPRASI